jgi:2-isopropylmalate synthase
VTNDLQLYDATLRDGMQGEGMSLTAAEKVRVAHALDELGIDLIEAGFPASNPKEEEVFDLLSRETFAHARVAAFGMTRRRDVAASDDEGLRILAASFAPVVTLVGKTWSLHLEKVLRVSKEENLAIIAESVAFLAEQGKEVVYDAEHFFDGYRDDPDYSLACLQAAVDGGATTLVPCDTNGSSLPHQITDAVTAVVGRFGDRARIGTHYHDDAGCGVANTLAGVLAGATQVQATLNGIGERTGNANMTTIIPNLQLKLGIPVVTDEQLALLTSTSHYLDELLNRRSNQQQPYVGRLAFTHKGGLHAAGVRADASTFEHVEPHVVGNVSDVVVSELAGRHAVHDKAAAAGVEVSDAVATKVVERVKQLEHLGYQFEAADGSFELLLRREAGAYEPLFTLESWRCIVEQRADGKVETEATVKLWIDGDRYVRTAEGNGPVNALDNALRAAIVETHPHLRDIELVNYKVRILDVEHGTNATTRVLIDSSDGEDTWGTVGVGENVIAASWQALVDSLERAEQPGRRRTGTGTGSGSRAAQA